MRLAIRLTEQRGVVCPLLVAVLTVTPTKVQILKDLRAFRDLGAAQHTGMSTLAMTCEYPDVMPKFLFTVPAGFAFDGTVDDVHEVADDFDGQTYLIAMPTLFLTEHGVSWRTRHARPDAEGVKVETARVDWEMLGL